MAAPPSPNTWRLPRPLVAPDAEAARALADLGLPEELLAVLQRRGHGDVEAIRTLLEPPEPPPAAEHFPQLAIAVKRLEQACKRGEAVAICGDYDADGMTSTALLLGVLQRLGAKPRAAIPSRMEEGYGLNAAMVETLAADGVKLLVTVDNGVSALEALERAEALGLSVILTDHHTLPDQPPPCLALLHPSCTPEDSPYRGLAGVGLAYVLAAALSERRGDRQGLTIARDLFCIGTIADMAPLQGVNRRWLLQGLGQLAHTALPGLRALIQLAGLEGRPIDAETVGFQLAPRINAVGRLGDPALVVELLTSHDPDRALELARSCELLNRQRRELCSAIEAEAVALLEADGEGRRPFLLLAQNHWHHGVIGIVAARLVERYGRPVALLAADGEGRLRASVRAPKGFAVDRALQHCSALLERHGGHAAAGGFTLQAANLAALDQALCEQAQAWLQSSDGGGPLVEPDALLPLDRIDPAFHRQLQRLGPFGIGMPSPLFWASDCQVRQQRWLRGGHLQLTLEQNGASLRAIGWRWQDQPDGGEAIPARVDVAFRLKRDSWQGEERLQLELAALRASREEVVLQRRDRTYWCRRQGSELLIRNAAGEELVEDPAAVSAGHPYLRALIEDAALALGMRA